jgi:hypothetical protein
VQDIPLWPCFLIIQLVVSKAITSAAAAVAFAISGCGGDEVASQLLRLLPPD